MNARTNAVAASTVSERRIERSCLSWKKHDLHRLATCLHIVRLLSICTPRLTTQSTAWTVDGPSTKSLTLIFCELLPGAKPNDPSFICIQFKSVAVHPPFNIAYTMYKTVNNIHCITCRCTNICLRIISIAVRIHATILNNRKQFSSVY